jgi:methylated-DNA-[protein]-cysteine S-methyltransferase
VNIRKPPKVLAECVFQLKQYFMGNRQCFDLALDLHGTPFQLRVWQELCKVPFGTTITYEKLAKKLGDKKAQRAVGGANGKNPVSVIIPCHRVIGKQGKLVGYAGGLDRKKWLLEFEHAFSQMDLFYE